RIATSPSGFGIQPMPIRVTKPPQGSGRLNPTGLKGGTNGGTRSTPGVKSLSGRGTAARPKGSEQGERPRRDPLGELKRLRPRRAYYHLAIYSPRRRWHRRRHHVDRSTLIARVPDVPTPA